MTSEVQLIYEKGPIGANLFKNVENDNSIQSIYVKSHFKGALSPKYGHFWLLVLKNSPSLEVYLSCFDFKKACQILIENVFSNLNNQYLVLGEV